jgi:hypothetical protein
VSQLRFQNLGDEFIYLKTAAAADLSVLRRNVRWDAGRETLLLFGPNLRRMRQESLGFSGRFETEVESGRPSPGKVPLSVLSPGAGH